MLLGAANRTFRTSMVDKGSLAGCKRAAAAAPHMSNGIVTFMAIRIDTTILIAVLTCSSCEGGSGSLRGVVLKDKSMKN